ncbi:MAG: FHA domain-containing protein, partial [Geminicoccaceae bacterium]
MIGRSLYANITLVDASVAPHHAELVVTDDDRYYLTDCASASGTWRR